MRFHGSANARLCFLLALTLCTSLLLLVGLQQWARQDLLVSIPWRSGNATQLRSSLHGQGPAATSAGSPSTAPALHQVAEQAPQSGLKEKEPPWRERAGVTPEEEAALLLWDTPLHRPGSGKHSVKLGDIFIAVKTTRKYHKARLDLLFQTWISLVQNQTFIFTDGEDKELRAKAGCNMINTNCSAAYTRQALCCKMSVEYDKFIESKKKWFCHFDDDNYVNIRNLVHLLSTYSHTQDVYIGRPSLDHPVEALERTSVKFWFATGGAGFCISRGLALKMSPWASFGNFISTAEKIRLPDDCTIGYIVEGLLEVKMIHSDLFHSHLENLQQLPAPTILKQVTLSYGNSDMKRNVLRVQGPFSLVEDPSRFKSIHCLLYHDVWCPPEDGQ
ncbi:beta-1,3-N-acetylglucosaminyltransferase radical fringe isoform X2 [Rhinoraja longicauda]